MPTLKYVTSSKCCLGLKKEVFIEVQSREIIRLTKFLVKVRYGCEAHAMQIGENQVGCHYEKLGVFCISSLYISAANKVKYQK
jgi:hypothetical protein